MRWLPVFFHITNRAINEGPLTPTYTLTVNSSPFDVTFTVNGVPHTTPWSETYNEDTSVILAMTETQTIGDARYYWDRWSDGEPSRSRTVTMDANLTLTGQFTGPYYELTIDSSPTTGITFTVDGVSKTTPYTEWLLSENSCTLAMPETHDGYAWSHWLDDGDTSRTKTITLTTGTTWVALYTPAPSPFWTQWWFWTTVIAAIAALIGAPYFLKKRKLPRTTPTVPPQTEKNREVSARRRPRPLPIENTPQHICLDKQPVPPKDPWTVNLCI